MTTSLLLSLALAQTPTYTEPGYAGFDPKQTFRSVGVFGSFGKENHLEERDNFGVLTFTVRKDAPENRLVWTNFDDGKDLELGRAIFAGTVTDKKFEFVDWTTVRLKFASQVEGRSVANEAVFSRAFPAALYSTQASTWTWRAAAAGADLAAYRNAEGKIVVARAGETLGAMGSPWVVIWGRAGVQGGVAPMLVRFERKPASLRLDGGLVAKFDRAAGRMVVMPLLGIRREKPVEWASQMPPSAVEQADLWSRITAAFPVQTDETFALDEAKREVRISDRYRYETLKDDWKTKPLTIAPVPPITALAEKNGYPVRWLNDKAMRSQVATSLGPFAYVPGERLDYAIPSPSARDNMLSPVRPLNDPSRQHQVDELTKLVTTLELKPDDYSDGGFNLQLKEYAQGFPLLANSTQEALRPKLARSLNYAYSPDTTQTVTDPVTQGRYVMSNKIWCVGEHYDREWYAGRQLDATAEYAMWIDPNGVKKHWPAIQGLYAYYRIYSDWAWSGTLSSLFAYALCGDGMNFAMEGMLGTARMAKRFGDEEVYRDASYRAAKQAVCTYGSWFLSQWVKDVDYVIWTDTSYDYETKKGRYEVKRMDAEDIQTGFGLDIYSDTSGMKAFRNGSFWHASAAFYWNNPSLYRLYAEWLYPKVYRWEMQEMPRLHPSWTDKDVIEKFTNQPYGSNMVVTHLDARTVLFGQSPEELEKLTAKMQTNLAPLYFLRMREDLAQSGIPQLWLPTAQARVTESSWDAKTRKLTAKLIPTSNGVATLDWTWRGTKGVSPEADPGPRPASVVVDGKRVEPTLVRGGFYRVRVALKEGVPTELTVAYRE